jgi:hypothetical protein
MQYPTKYNTLISLFLQSLKTRIYELRIKEVSSNHEKWYPRTYVLSQYMYIVNMFDDEPFATATRYDKC